MKILIISIFDDNFGDMLIRICFERILKTVLKNLNIKDSDYTIDCMPIRQIDEDKIAVCNMIFFPGGGLFGLSYLNLFKYLDVITKIAEENHIPVIFSSLGINNMDATEENEQQLSELLKRSCIKAMSVRENPELFRHYAKDCSFEIVQVCDPAVWTKYVYSQEIKKVRMEKKNNGHRTVGINVVRGGLFKANNKAWTLGTEEACLIELKRLLEDEGIAVCFFTNGSSLDNNSMAHFAQKYEIPDEQLVYTHTTRELVETISGFDAVIAIRMHASIISYALDIPSIDLAWNDKILFFYKNIGYPDRAMPLEECTSELVFEKAKMLLEDTDYATEQNYMMSLYRYLYHVLSELLQVDGGSPYSFEEITKELALYGASANDDIIDFRVTIEKGTDRYLSLYTKNIDAEKQIKTLKSDNKNLKSDNKNLNSENKKLKKQIDDQKKKIAEANKTAEETRKKLIKEQQESAKLKQQLDRINKKFVVRVYRKLRRILSRLKRI